MLNKGEIYNFWSLLSRKSLIREYSGVYDLKFSQLISVSPSIRAQPHLKNVFAWLVFMLLMFCSSLYYGWFALTVSLVPVSHPLTLGALWIGDRMECSMLFSGLLPLS